MLASLLQVSSLLQFLSLPECTKSGSGVQLASLLPVQFNTYPDTRNFKAIGEGGDDFVQSMASAVEQVLGPVKRDCIRQRLSAKQKYVSVTIGPVRVEHSDQV